MYGVVAALSGWGEFTGDWITPFGTIFLRLLLLIAVPLVLASLITGIASLADLNKLSRIGGKTIAIYLVTTFIALIIEDNLSRSRVFKSAFSILAVIARSRSSPTSEISRVFIPIGVL